MKKVVIFVFLLISINYIYSQKLPTIAVFDFSYSEQLTESEMSSIISILSSELFKTGKYTIIDTQQRDMLIKEMEFSMSGLSDEENLLRLGKLLQAESIITGKIGFVGKRIVINSKMLETETAKIQSTADGVYDDINFLLDDIPNIALLLAGLDKSVETAESNEAVVENTDTPSPSSDSKNNNISVDKTNKIIGFSTLGAGVVLTGVGTYFLIDSIIKLSDVQTTKSAYENATSDFDNLYTVYMDSYAAAENSNTMFFVGAGLIGSGIISGVVSAIFFTKDSVNTEAPVSVAIGYNSFRIKISL
jgi:hypothetical protein